MNDLIKREIEDLGVLWVLAELFPDHAPEGLSKQCALELSKRLMYLQNNAAAS